MIRADEHENTPKEQSQWKAGRNASMAIYPLDQEPSTMDGR